MNANSIINVAALSGLLAVGLGAFGAHGLKPLLNAYQIAIYEKAVLYQFIHTLAVLGTGIVALQQPSKRLSWAAISFLIGIVLFSGSLYLLACRDVLGIAHWTWIGPITPIGGLAFMAGWLLLWRGLAHK